MRTLFHIWPCPSCRMARVALAEKGLEFELRLEKIWERREEFLHLSPGGDLPVLVEEDRTTIIFGDVIAEYLDETFPERPLIGTDARQRAETRRLVEWFGRKFFNEVTQNIAGEKIMRRLLRNGEPETATLRAGAANIHYHLDYIGWLTERRKWLAGETFSLADIAAASQLSSVDYLGDVPWDDHPAAKDWYARVKCRPSFRPLLSDYIPGMPAAKHYADLDF